VQATLALACVGGVRRKMSSSNIIFYERVKEAFQFLIEDHGYHIVEQQAHESLFYGGKIYYASTRLHIFMSWERIEYLSIQLSPPETTNKIAWELFPYVLGYINKQKNYASVARDFSGEPEKLSSLLSSYIQKIEHLFSANQYQANKSSLHSYALKCSKKASY
jgi:hypothetical protein